MSTYKCVNHISCHSFKESKTNWFNSFVFSFCKRMALTEWITQIVSKSISQHFLFSLHEFVHFPFCQVCKITKRNTFLKFLLTASAIQFWCSCVHCRCFRQWTGVRTGTLSGLQPHIELIDVHCLFWHLSIRTSLNFFGNLSYNNWTLFTHDPSPVCLPWTLW